MSYIKRSVFTFAFKGRARRGLFWKKDVYRLWFEYAKISPLPIPKEFGDLSQFDDFENWWKHPKYGFELFCEPVKKKVLSVVKEIDNKNSNDVIYLSVDLTAEPQKLKRMFSTILKNKSKVKPVKSLAKFQPSLHWKYIRIYALEQYLDTWTMRKIDGMTRDEIHTKRYGNKTKISNGKSNLVESDLRVISRQTQRANEIFKNIENGTFP